MQILEDIRPIMIPAHLLSVVPHYTLVAGEIEMSKPGKRYAFLLAIFVALTSSVVCINVVSDSHNFKIMSISGDTEEINQTIETLFCVISFTIIIATGSLNAAKHFRMLNEIARIDESLIATGYSGSYKCPKLTGVLYAMCTVVIGVAYYYIRRSPIQSTYRIVLLGVYLMQLYVSCTFAVYFRLILLNVTKRIEFVNEKSKQFTRDGTRSNEENWCELSNLMELFCKFRYITDNLNAVTGVGLLFYMGYAFYTVTNQSYLAFSMLTNDVAFSEKFQLMGLSASWVIAEIVIMSVLCSSCETISSELSSGFTSIMGIRVQKIQKKNILEEDHANACDILTELNLVLCILKAAGLFPIFTQSTRDQVEPPSKQNQFYSLFVRCVFYSLTIVLLYFMFRSYSTQILWLTVGTDTINQFMKLIIGTITYIGLVILCALNSKRFLRIINGILRVDAEILQNYGAGVRAHCEYARNIVVLIIIWEIVMFAVMIIGMNLTLVFQYVFFSFITLQDCLCSLLIILLSTLLQLTAVRFDFVNMLLESYNYDVAKGAGAVSFQKDASFAFRLHNSLLKIYKTINESCSLLVALFMGHACYQITTITYTMFVEFTTKRENSAIMLLNSFALMGLKLIVLTTLTNACGQATKKANATSQILARVYGKGKDYQNIIDKFLTKSIRQEVRFTAYGLFVVDNGTLFKMFSAVTTYLVILIQFKQLEDTKLDEEAESKSN